jgi:D-alanine-D-alanine ligase
MKVAVVRNKVKSDGVINRFGQACPESYGATTIRLVVEGLKGAGHTVEELRADKTLLAELERFMPPDPATGRPTGMVFNMAYGIQGECRYTHTPAMLEMAGVPYTGSSPLGHALSLDKVVTKILMVRAGVPTPSWQVMRCPERKADDLQYPLVVKPVHESTSFGLHLVRDQDELAAAVQTVVTKYEQDALVEEYVDGREVAVGLLGNDPPECLPLVEMDFGGRDLRAMTYDDKYHKRPDEPTKICPAPVSDAEAAMLRDLAIKTFRACHCKDYARVDIRIDPAGRPFVLEINSMASLGPGGSFVMAATRSGYTHPGLVNHILDVAHRRYFGTVAPCGSLAPQPPVERKEV